MAAKTKLPPDLKKRLLALVHLAPKQLGLDEEARRDLQEEVTGKRSASEMTVAELNHLIAVYRSLGFKVETKGGGGYSPKYDDPQKAKIVALWITCFQQGVVENRSHAALERFVKRVTGVAKLEWLTPPQANQAIEALKQMLDRAEAQGVSNAEDD